MDDEILKHLKAYSLSDSDIQVVLNPDTKIQTYDKLYNITHIDELFDNLGRCIILYLTENKNTGHWVGVIKKGNQIEFFDPYGYFPDTQNVNLNVPAHINKEFGQDYPRFLELVADAGYSLVFNNKPLQKENYDIATCGRHTASRLLFYKLSLDEYYKLMKELKDIKKIKTVDDVVTKFTHELINK